VPIKGTYSGLFYPTNGVLQSNSGAFTLSTTVQGKYTGKIQMGNTRYSISGQLNHSGQASNTILRGTQNPLNLDLQMDWEDSDRLTGILTDGSWVAALWADRGVFDLKINRAPEAGQYTLVIPGALDSTVEPGGDSYATLSVQAAGQVRLAGTLADGTKFMQSAQVSKDGQWPLYVPLYSGQGSLLSWIAFGVSDSDDLSGVLNWIKPNLPKAKFYPGGFTMNTTASGSRYLKPALGQRVLDFSEGTVQLSGAYLTNGLFNDVLLGADNKATNLSSNKLTLTFTLSSGLFRGNVVDSGTGKLILFNGVVLQKSNLGSGYFLDAGQSGWVSFGPNIDP
jgi:hypothetical protein